MPLDIRILSGARAGQAEHFDKEIVLVGRHAVADLRFDPQQDLDVSGRHAEIRVSEGLYFVHDIGSTNGTLVNGQKITGTVELQHGDKIKFGTAGPEVEVLLKPKATTEERIAVAVHKQTAGLRRYAAAAAVIVIAAVAMGYFGGRRGSASDPLATPQGSAAISDSLQREIQRRLDSLGIDLPSLNARNAPAVAIMIAEIGGKPFAGTAFSIHTQGVLITNRHNVLGEDGTRPTRIAIKFRDTREWLPGRVLKVSDRSDVDLALIQVDGGETFPVVAGVAARGDLAVEGHAVATIGFPLGLDTPMEGRGNDFMAKTTLNGGTVSKRVSNDLQIDTFAHHGSSGSPVFNSRGHVVGVVYGGATESAGRIVYAVPAERIAEFIPREYRAIIR